MEDQLTHLNEKGEAHMVDVSAKSSSLRRACARGFLRLNPDTISKLNSGAGPKGDAYGVARIAAILAAKRTDELIPLCHTLGLDHCEVRFAHSGDVIGVEVISTCHGTTGVEMEALVGVQIGLATLFDMAKALSPEATFFGVHVAWKIGGKRGEWHHPSPPFELDVTAWG